MNDGYKLLNMEGENEHLMFAQLTAVQRRSGKMEKKHWRKN